MVQDFTSFFCANCFNSNTERARKTICLFSRWRSSLKVRRELSLIQEYKCAAKLQRAWRKNMRSQRKTKPGFSSQTPTVNNKACFSYKPSPPKNAQTLISELPEILKKAIEQGFSSAQIMHVAFASPSLEWELPPPLSFDHYRVISELMALGVQPLLVKGVYYSSDYSPCYYAWIIRASWQNGYYLQLSDT